MSDAHAAEIVAFWRDAGASRWFNGGPAFDAECRERFKAAHLSASRGEMAGWMGEADSALALLILLDQIPRNIYRGSGHAFATDGLARRYALQAVEAGLDARMPADLRLFAYLPFEHAEDLADQDRAVALIGALGNAELDRYARAHREVIARFGRFPHRNAALGRTSTPDEQAWLDAGGGF